MTGGDDRARDSSGERRDGTDEIAPPRDLTRLPLFDDVDADPVASTGREVTRRSGRVRSPRPWRSENHPLATAEDTIQSTLRGTAPDLGVGGGVEVRHSDPEAPAAQLTGVCQPTRPPLGAAPRAELLPPAQPRGMDDGIDWPLVRAFRQEAASRLTAAIVDREGITDADRHELGRTIIWDLLSTHAREVDAVGRYGFTPDEQQQLAQAVFDSLFGLGRLQPLVDNPDLENIEIRGYDNVHLVFADGRIEPGPPVADSDEELIDTLAFLAARSGGTERPFSPSNPDLDLRLPGGARLAASAWNTPRPLVVIRLHRLVDVALDALVHRGTLESGMASFLRAAIRAKMSVLISGAMGAGKTTMARAVCNELDPLEAIGTIETEYELHLHEMPDRHRRCSAWEARPGSGERNTEGRRIGEVTLDDIVYRSLRMNLSRIIVGEVRGKEVIPMFKAMQAGAGSVSTIHAYSARAAIERLVTCATEAGPQISETWAYRQVAEHINIVVHVAMEDAVDEHGEGRRRRWVAEVIALEPGEDGRPAVTDVYAPGPDGRTRPGVLPQWLRGLTQWGFDDSEFRHIEAVG